MSKIKVYFTNGNTGIFDRATLSFRDSDGSYFCLGDDKGEENDPRKQYATLLDAGPLINFDAVSWVRAYREEEDNA